MINTVTTHTYYLSPAYFLLFLVLVGFVYHLIRNKEYKNSLPASIIIGVILGLIFNSAGTLLFFLGETLIFIVLIILGGFLAVGLKKLKQGNTVDKGSPETPSKGYRRWWDKQSQKDQAIIVVGVCLLGIVVIVGMICLLTPVENPVQFGPEFTPSNGFINANYTDDGKMVVFIANNTTQCVLTGSSEVNATVKITSSDLGIYNQDIPLDAENRFTYNLDLPEDFSSIKIILNATKSGKDDIFTEFFIEKQ